MPRRRRGQSNTHTAKETVEAVRGLAHVCPDDLIAGVLNRHGLRTGRGNRWSRQRVISLRSTHKIPRYCPEQRTAEGWMNLTEAAEFLGVSPGTLRLAAERGELNARHPLSDGPWVFNRAALQSDVAIQLVARVRSRGANPAKPPAEQANLDLSIT